MILREHFHQSKIKEIKEREGEHLESRLPINLIFMVVLNIVELGAGIWFLGNMTIFGNKIPRFLIPLIASTPVAYTWICAKYQADSHEIPKYFYHKNNEYQKSIFPNSNTPNHVLIEDELSDLSLEAQINNIVNNGCPYDNPVSASEAEETKHIKFIIGQLQSNCQEKLSQRKAQLKTDLDAVSTKLPTSGGMGAKQREGVLKNAISAKKQQLKDNAEHDYQLIKERYQAEIDRWQMRISETLPQSKNTQQFKGDKSV